jgi:transposase
MKALTISDPTVVLSLQDEIRRSDESRYDHRLHALLLVAQGLSCRKAAELLGDSPRAIQYVVKRFEKDGLQGLAEGERAGRPRRLSPAQMAKIEDVLRSPPSAEGLRGNIWDGKTLSTYIKRAFSVKVGVRQCQRLFRQLGFRLRKPRPIVAQADPEKQATAKKYSAR